MPNNKTHRTHPLPSPQLGYHQGVQRAHTHPLGSQTPTRPNQERLKFRLQMDRETNMKRTRCIQCNCNLSSRTRSDAKFCSIMCKNIYNNDRRRLTSQLNKILSALNTISQMRETPAGNAEFAALSKVIHRSVRSLHHRATWTCKHCGKTTFINPYSSLCPFCKRTKWYRDPPTLPLQIPHRNVKN